MCRSKTSSTPSTFRNSIGVVDPAAVESVSMAQFSLRFVSMAQAESAVDPPQWLLRMGECEVRPVEVGTVI